MPDKDLNTKIAESPDFLLRELDTGGKDAIGDIFSNDSEAQNYTLRSKGEYMKNAELMKDFEALDINFDDFYGSISGKYQKLKDLDFDVTSFEHGPIFESAFTKMAGIDAINPTDLVREGTMEETKVLDYLTPLQVAQAKGELLEDGSYNVNADASFWDNVTSGDGFKIASEGKGEDFKFKTDDKGYFFLDKYEGAEELSMHDVVQKVWSTGWSQGTFLDANKKDEPWHHVALRKSPQIAAAVLGVLAAPATAGSSLALASSIMGGLAVVPFFMDAVNGGAEAIASIIGISGGEKKAWTEEVQNYLDKFGFDKTESEMKNPFGLKSIINNTADILTQLKGMQTIAKYGAKGMTALTNGLKAKGATSPFAGYMSGLVANASMAVSATNDFKKEAKEYGIDDEHIDMMHLGLIGGYMMVNKISEPLWNPVQKNIQRQTFFQMLKEELPAWAGKVGKITQQKVNNFIFKVANKSKSLSDRAWGAYTTGSALGLKRFGVNAVSEGLEEVSEGAMEQAFKSVYNNYSDAKDNEAGRGRFRNFNYKEFARESAISFMYGAIGGGVFGTSMGKKILRQNPDHFTSLAQYAKTPEGRAAFRKDMKRFSELLGDDKLSYATDSNETFQLANNKSENPLMKRTQRETNTDILMSSMQAAENYMDITLNDATSEESWNEAVDKQFNGIIKANQTNINDDLVKKVDEMHKQDIKLDEVAEKLSTGNMTEEEADKASNKIKSNKTRIENEIESILSGERANDYIIEGILKNLNANLSPEEFRQMNADLVSEIEAVNKENEATIEDANGKAELIRNAATLEEVAAIVRSGNMTPEAKEAAKARFKEADMSPVQTLIELGVDRALEVYEGNRDELVEKVNERGALNAASLDLDLDQEDKITPGMYLTPEEMTSLKQYKETLMSDDDIDKSIGVMLKKPTASLHSAPTSGENVFALARTMLDENRTAGDDTKKAAEEINKRIQHIETLKKILPLVDAFDITETSYMIPEFGEFTEDAIRAKIALKQEWSKKNINNLVEATKEAYSSLDSFSTDLKSVRDALNKKYNDWRSSNIDPVSELKHKFKKKLDNDVKLLQEEILHKFEAVREYEEFSAAMKVAEQAFEQAAATSVDDFPAMLRAFNEGHKIIHDALKKLDPAQRVVIRDQISNTPSNLAMSYLNMFERIDPSDFNQKLLQLLKNNPEGRSAPTWEQQQAVMYAYSKMLWEADKGSKKTIAVMHNEKPGLKRTQGQVPAMTWENAVFVEGAWGSGKTTYIVGTAMKMVSDEFKNDKKPYKVLTAAYTEDQQKKLTQEIDATDVPVANINEDHIDHEKLITLVQNKASQLDDVMALVYDEATFIPYADETQKKLFLEELNKAVKAYNEAKRGDSVPLQVVFVGDGRQQGALDKTGRQYNISAYYTLERTPYVESSQRQSYTSITVTLDELVRASKVLGYKKSLSTTYGMDGDTPAGIQITKDTDSKDQAIQEILDTGGTFKYVTDRNATDEELLRLYEKFPELEKHAIHPTKVQGGEVDYIIADYKSMDVRDNTADEGNLMASLATTISRATNKVVLHNDSKSRLWNSKEAPQELSGHKLEEAHYEAITADTISVLEEITGEPKVTETEETEDPNPETNEEVVEEVEQEEEEEVEDEKKGNEKETVTDPEEEVEEDSSLEAIIERNRKDSLNKIGSRLYLKDKVRKYRSTVTDLDGNESIIRDQEHSHTDNPGEGIKQKINEFYDKQLEEAKKREASETDENQEVDEEIDTAIEEKVLDESARVKADPYTKEIDDDVVTHISNKMSEDIPMNAEELIIYSNPTYSTAIDTATAIAKGEEKKIQLTRDMALLALDLGLVTTPDNQGVFANNYELKKALNKIIFDAVKSKNNKEDFESVLSNVQEIFKDHIGHIQNKDQYGIEKIAELAYYGDKLNDDLRLEEVEDGNNSQISQAIEKGFQSEEELKSFVDNLGVQYGPFKTEYSKVVKYIIDNTEVVKASENNLINNEKAGKIVEAATRARKKTNVTGDLSSGNVETIQRVLSADPTELKSDWEFKMRTVNGKQMVVARKGKHERAEPFMELKNVPFIENMDITSQMVAVLSDRSNISLTQTITPADRKGDYNQEKLKKAGMNVHGNTIDELRQIVDSKGMALGNTVLIAKEEIDPGTRPDGTKYDPIPEGSSYILIGYDAAKIARIEEALYRQDTMPDMDGITPIRLTSLQMTMTNLWDLYSEKQGGFTPQTNSFFFSNVYYKGAGKSKQEKAVDALRVFWSKYVSQMSDDDKNTVERMAAALESKNVKSNQFFEEMTKLDEDIREKFLTFMDSRYEKTKFLINVTNNKQTGAQKLENSSLLVAYQGAEGKGILDYVTSNIVDIKPPTIILGQEFIDSMGKVQETKAKETTIKEEIKKAPDGVVPPTVEATTKEDIIFNYTEDPMVKDTMMKMWDKGIDRMTRVKMMLGLPTNVKNDPEFKKVMNKLSKC